MDVQTYADRRLVADIHRRVATTDSQIRGPHGQIDDLPVGGVVETTDRRTIGHLLIVLRRAGVCASSTIKSHWGSKRCGRIPSPRTRGPSSSSSSSNTESHEIVPTARAAEVGPPLPNGRNRPGPTEDETAGRLLLFRARMTSGATKLTTDRSYMQVFMRCASEPSI